MVEHRLKTDPDAFDAVFTNKKKHEIRLDDRKFNVGDKLILVKTAFNGSEMKEKNQPLIYTGDEIQALVTHIQRGYGLMPGWVIMSIDVIGRLSNMRSTRSEVIL